MMKKLLMTAIGAMSLVLSASAIAGSPDNYYSMDTRSGFYIGADAGAAIPGNLDGLETGPSVNGQFGYDTGMFRLELAGNYLRNYVENFNNIYLNIFTLMVNGYYDFHNSSLVTPFIGAGAGWLRAWETGIVGVSIPADNEFAYQGIAGLSFRVTDSFDIDVRYRILGWTDGNGYENIVEAGFNYFF